MNIFSEKTKVCFIGAHPDDIELGCGGLISNIRDKCKDILCVTLSKNKDNPENKELVKEHNNSLNSLGIPAKNIILENFITKHFCDSRQEICDYLLELNKKYQPDIIFTHSFSDIHQDHEIVSKEVFRIFKQKTIIGFEILPSSYNFSPNFFFEISEKDLKKKIEALGCYKIYKAKNYFFKDVIYAQLVRNGMAIQAKYAEGFNIVRLSCKI